MVEWDEPSFRHPVSCSVVNGEWVWQRDNSFVADSGAQRNVHIALAQHDLLWPGESGEPIWDSDGVSQLGQYEYNDSEHANGTRHFFGVGNITHGIVDSSDTGR
jgi:hypothetical protein